VPVEGQWSRVNTPLSRRDRRVLAIAACAVVLAAAGAAVAVVLHPSPSNAGCVIVTVASTTGGVVMRNCGAGAKTFCRDSSNLGDAVEQCRRLGYPIRRR
jgi:hypothetical protein